MENTKLIYMEDMQRTQDTAKVLGVSELDGKTVVELDQTIFYPQGGGQPYDQGVIEKEGSSFQVLAVRYEDGIVKHIGEMKHGKFEVGDEVMLHVDEAWRMLHSRLHSGGHLLDMAISKLGFGWIPGKGYHYPEGPYIEYDGSYDEAEKESLRKKIEDSANELIAQAIPTTISFLSDELVNGKPARVVMYGDFKVPCGGTHVSNLKDIGHLTIRKISSKKGLIRAAYTVE